MKQTILFLFFILIFPLIAKDFNFSLEKKYSFSGLVDNPIIQQDKKTFFFSSSGVIFYKNKPYLNLGYPSLLNPLQYKDKYVFFLNNGEIWDVNLKTKKLSKITHFHSGFLTNPICLKNTLYFITSDEKFYSYNLSNKKKTFLGFIPSPIKSAFKITNNILEISTTSSQVYQYSLKKRKIKKIVQTSVKSQNNFTQNTYKYSFLCKKKFKANSYWLTFDQKNLITFSTNNKIPQLVFDDLSVYSTYFFHYYNQKLYINNLKGDLFIFKYKESPSKDYIPKTHTITNYKNITLKQISDFLVIEKNKKVVFAKQFKNLNPKQIDNIYFTDVNKDGLKDIFILVSTNPMLDYERLYFFKQTRKRNFAITSFDTVGARKIKEIFIDINNDKKKELVLFQEIGFNFSRDKQKRLFVPDVYSYKDNRFQWNSLNFPNFYKQKIKTIKKKMKSNPFYEAWARRLWKIYTEKIYHLEENLITLHKQLISLNKKNRSKKNKKGLSFWFYKKGLEYKKNGWDNLALFIFNKAYNLDKQNNFILFQISRIYLKYGLYDDALKLYSHHPQLPFIKNIFYKEMEDEPEPFILNPTKSYINFNLGEINYFKQNYATAIFYLRKVSVKDLPFFFQKRTQKYLAYSYIYDGQYKKARELFRKLYKKTKSKEFEIALKKLKDL